MSILKRTLIVILSLCILTACAASKNDNSNDIDSFVYSGTASEYAGEGDYVTYEEVKEKYPDKTVLVWQLHFGAANICTEEINEYLNSLGKDYAVCFLPASIYEDEYIDIVKDKISSGEQIDLLFTGYRVSWSDSWGLSPYTSFIDAELLAPLDNYLAETEIGQELYDLMPEGYWESVSINGSVYGFGLDLNYLSYDTYIESNEELVNKYGFDTEVSIFEQAETVAEIVEAEDCVGLIIGNPLPYYFLPSDTPSLGGAAYYDSESDSIRSVLECEEYTDYLKGCFEFLKAGLAVSDLSSSDATAKSSVYARVINVHGDFSSDQGVWNGRTFDVIRVKIADSYYIKSKTVNGVCSYSENKDMAFDLLALSMTDEYLNNLLTFGTDTDYIMDENGIINYFEYINGQRFSNRLLCTASYDLSCYNDNCVYSPELLSERLEDIDSDPLIGFTLDVSDLKEEIRQIDSVVNSIDGVLSDDSYETFGELLAELEDLLDDAGLQTLLDEANRQYAGWRDSE